MNNDISNNENEIVTNEAPVTEAVENTAPEAPSNDIKSKITALISRFGKKKLIAIGCAAAVLISVIVAIAIANTPAAVASRTLGNMTEALIERKEVEYATSLLKTGSLEFAVDGTIEGVKLDASGKLYLNVDDREAMLDKLSLSVKNGDKKAELTAAMYASEKKVYVTNKDILGGSYGIVKGTLEKKLKNSILNPESESAYALPAETYEALLNACKIADSDLSKDLEKDAEKVFERYTGKLKGWLNKYAEFKTVDQKIDLHDGDKKAEVTYIIITPKTIAEIADEFYEYVKTDKKLRELVIKYYNETSELMTLTYGLGEEFDIADAYDDAIDSLGDSIEAMVDNLENADQDNFYALCMATPKNSTKLMKMWLIRGDDIDDFDDEDEVKELCSVDFGSKGIEKTNQIVIKTNGEKIKYTVDTETKGVTEYKLQIGSSAKISLKLDKKAKEFKFTYSERSNYSKDEMNTFVVEGEYTAKSDKATFTLKNVKANGEKLELDLDATVTLDKKDKMPRAEKKITSIFDLNDEKIQEIMDNAQEWAGSFN